MPAAVAIPAAVSVGSSLLGGVLGSSAAKKAAAAQQQAAQNAAGELKGVLAANNPLIGQAADTAAGNVNAATTAGQAGITGAVGAGQGRIDAATGQAIGLLQPYMDAGGQSLSTLMSGLAPGGDLNKTFTAADMQQYDPGYAFRIAQANKALAGSQAARGGALGGGALSAVEGLNQNLASSEFGNAEARFRAQQNDRFSRLNSLVNLGATTSNQAAGYGMTGANEAANLGLSGATSSADLGLRGATTAGGYTTNAADLMAGNTLNTYGKIEDLMTGGAAAKAAGTVGSANAWGSALGGVSNAANSVGAYYQDKDLQDQMAQNGYGAPSPYSGTRTNPNGSLTVFRNPALR